MRAIRARYAGSTGSIKKCSRSNWLNRHSLLLAPHIDHLFDRGWISFADNGDLLISTELDPGVLATWHITPGVNTGGFSEAQAGFLQHHRAHVFRDRPV
jgi:hypothetical protein